MSSNIQFFTATCLRWQNLLDNDIHKDIIINSLCFMVNEKRIWVYGFVIMPNHIHILWRIRDKWLDHNIKQIFLKYTAQNIKFQLLKSNPNELHHYISSQKDRKYHFWERRSYASEIYNRKVLEQKLDYIHFNPVKANLSNTAEEYKYSSAKFYKEKETDWDFLIRYEEHI